MENIYRNDAYKLAIKRLNDIGSPWKDSVVIPAVYIDSIARALYAMHNMQRSAIKDTLQYYFGYSDFSSPSYQYRPGSFHILSAGEGYAYNYRLKAFTLSVFNNTA